MLPSNTPCPAPAAPRRSSSIALMGDDTRTIDFTRAVDLPPRRHLPAMRSAPIRQGIKNNLGFVAEDFSVPASSGGTWTSGKTLLSKPALRSRRMVGGSSTSSSVKPREVHSQGAWTKGPGSKEVMMSDLTQRSVQRMEYGGDPVGGAKEDGSARRRTIFVPSDDTTLLTIHPGAHHTNCLDDTFHIDTPNPFRTTYESHAVKQKPMRKPKRFSLAAAPKRMPLGQIMQSPQAQGLSTDIAGAPTGKENVPPRLSTHPPTDRDQKPKPKSKRMSTIPNCTSGPLTVDIISAKEKRPAPLKSATKTKQSPRGVIEVIEKVGGMSITTAKPVKSASSASTSTVQVPLSASKAPPPSSLKATIAERRRQMKQLSVKLFPRIADTVDHPELHDDNWIDHQESAITRVINAIFDDAGLTASPAELSHDELRARMLCVYDTEEVKQINHSLQDALKYGSIQPTTDPNYSTDRTRDLGLRRQFMGLWTNTYNQKLLSAAVEVVTGRLLPSSDPAQVGNTIDPHAEKRNLNLFLESFFIYDVGMEHPIGATEIEIAESRERKTIQRCLMLIWVLDRTQDEGDIPGLLFKRTAELKCSEDVITVLGRLLLPNSPHLIRALKMLDYHVCHIQAPDCEIQYHIDNLAVDMRDGTILVKLVELLVFSNHGQPRVLDFCLMDDMMLSEATWCTEPYGPANRNLTGGPILSRHLEYPCVGDASKEWNLQLALDAFNAACLQDGYPPTRIERSDILNGHREKTLHLLSKINSYYGITQIVEWPLLVWDIQHAGGDLSFLHPNREPGPPSIKEQELFLQAWATVHAAKQGVAVKDLTTSFGSIRTWTALCAAYPGDDTQTTSCLEDMLISRGCSNTWADHICSTLEGAVPNRITTIANLAYLASVVLPRERLRLVIVLQRAWRKMRARQELRPE